MDIRLSEAYEEALKALADKFHEPTAVGMNRILIREAAMQHGVWLQPDKTAAAPRPQPAPAQPAEAAA